MCVRVAWSLPPGQEYSPGELTAHLHDETLVVAAPGLRNELVFEATPLFIKFHNRVLAMLGQDRPLLFYVLRENRKENQKTQLRAFQHVEGSCTPKHDRGPPLHFPCCPSPPSSPCLRKSSEGLPATGLPPTCTLSLGNGLTSTWGHPTLGPQQQGPLGGGSKAHTQLPVQTPRLEATLLGAREITRTSNHAGSQDTELPAAPNRARWPPPCAHLGGGIRGEGSTGG